MGCNCGGVPAGYTRRYRLIRTGKPTLEFDTQGAALTEQRQSGGGGRVTGVLVRNRT